MTHSIPAVVGHDYPRDVRRSLGRSASQQAAGRWDGGRKFPPRFGSDNAINAINADSLIQELDTAVATDPNAEAQMAAEERKAKERERSRKRRAAAKMKAAITSE